MVVMDGNKDEAARCVGIAKSALNSGNKQRALKFIKIAQCLDSSATIEELLAACKKMGDPTSTVCEEGLSRDHISEKPSSSNASGNCNGYNEEHVKLIREVKKNKDYYVILGVERNCSLEEIKRAYRKLSLKVHPDKNKAPGAEEAFKTVSKAFKCLNDEKTRRNYDQKGHLEEHEFNQQQNNLRRRRRRATRDEFFDEDYDPDEIFRSFFYCNQEQVFRAQRVRRTRGMAREQREHNFHGLYKIITLLQIVLISLLLLFACLPFSQPHYSVRETHRYHIPKVTDKHGVEYFVKSAEFDQQFPPGSSARHDLEFNVLWDFRNVLGQYCRMELTRRQWVRDYPTPHCDRWRNLGSA